MKKYIYKTVVLENTEKNKDLWKHIEKVIKLANKLE